MQFWGSMLPFLRRRWRNKGHQGISPRYSLYHHLIVILLCVTETKTMNHIFNFFFLFVYSKQQEIPEPTSHIISHWGDDPYTRMAYSYVKVGSSGQDLDLIAAEVEEKLFFAGEVSSLHHTSCV